MVRSNCNRAEILASPVAFEPDVFYKMSLTSHLDLLQQAVRGEVLPTVFKGQRKANLGLTRIVSEDAESAIAPQAFAAYPLDQGIFLWAWVAKSWRLRLEGDLPFAFLESNETTERGMQLYVGGHLPPILPTFRATAVLSPVSRCYVRSGLVRGTGKTT